MYSFILFLKQTKIEQNYSDRITQQTNELANSNL